MAAAVAATFTAAPSARAVDIVGVQSGALDQPQIHALVYVGNAATPQINPTGVEVPPEDILDPPTYLPGFTFTAYLDTGASGVLLSGGFDAAGVAISGVAASFGIPLQPHPTLPGQFVQYGDVGVGGIEHFFVTDSIRMSLAAFVNGRTDLNVFDAGVPVTTPYTPMLGGGLFRAQTGPSRPIIVNDANDELMQLIGQLSAGDLNVIGMPAMNGKVVVIDPKRVNNFGTLIEILFGGIVGDELPDTSMRTWIYNQNTPFNPAYNSIPESDTTTEPGIPATSHKIRMTYASFDRFTTLEPGTAAGAQWPLLSKNPFIGKNPVDGTGTAPGVILTRSFTDALGVQHDGRVEASLLLDTGAAASIISKKYATQLGFSIAFEVISANDPFDPERTVTAPYLVDASGERIAEQFRLSLNGVGTDPDNPTILPGFYLDSLILRTISGDTADDNDPDHIRFLGAPVLVGDITLKDPITGEELTLDGILGMNFMTASMGLDDGIDIFELLSLPVSGGAFDWITIDFTDENEGILGLNFAGVPEPASLALLAAAAPLLLARRRRRD